MTIPGSTSRSNGRGSRASISREPIQPPEAWAELCEERAAILEHDGHHSRDEAERLAPKLVKQWLQDHVHAGDCPCPSSTPRRDSGQTSGKIGKAPEKRARLQLADDPVRHICADDDLFIRFPRWLVRGEILARLARAQSGTDRLFLVNLVYASMRSSQSTQTPGLITAGIETLKKEAALGSEQFDRCMKLLMKPPRKTGLPNLLIQRKPKTRGQRGSLAFLVAGLVELRQQAMRTISHREAEAKARSQKWQQNLIKARAERWPRPQNRGLANARAPQG